jgi:hypothetical protein
VGTSFSIVLWVLGGIVGLVLLYLVFMVLGTLVTLVLGNRPKGVEINVVAPGGMRVGQEGELVLTVRDTLGRERRLDSVDFDAEYLKGLEITRFEPRPVERTEKPMLGTWVNHLRRRIPAGGTETVRVGLRATSAGDYAGNVTVYVDSRAFRYVQVPVRTLVIDEDLVGRMVVLSAFDQQGS